MIESTRVCPRCRQGLAANAEVCENCEQEFCPSCLAPIDAAAESCAACGAEFALICPQCDSEVATDSSRCPECGYVFDPTAVEVISSRAAVAQATLTQAGMTGELQDEEPDGRCPACGEPVFISDGTCEACEAVFCPECLAIIDEDDDRCPHCDTVLYFDCPLCGFELTAGTDLCPSCGALFYFHCPVCDAEVLPLAESCTGCGTELVIEQRDSSRVIQTLVVGQKLVRVFACTNCGTQFDSSRPQCPSCGQRVCPSCQLILYEEEEYCPRCRPDIAAKIMAAMAVPATAVEVERPGCPTCGEAVGAGDDSCKACGQLLCPNCLAAVGEADLFCPRCGAEFELLCPLCEATVDAEAEHCPHCGADLEGG